MPSSVCAALSAAVAVVGRRASARRWRRRGQSSAAGQRLDRMTRAFQDLRWRNVGPTRGGRVTAIAGVRSQPCTYYMGATGGGVWKTENCGTDWTPIERRPDRHRLDRLDRCLRIQPERRLGRHRQRRHPQQRDHRPRRLPVHRRRADLAVHGSQGLRPDRRHRHSSRPTPTSSGWRRWDRRSGPTRSAASSRPTDGGKTWKKTLFVNNETGGRVVAINYANPNELYAGMYRGFRKGWDIISGGPASEGGIYKSTDGGETWTQAVERSAVDADRQDRHRRRAQPAATGLRDGRSAGRRRRAVQVDRRGRVVEAREQRGESSEPAVLLPLRRRQSEGPERRLGQRAHAAAIARRRADLQRRADAACATTTASGSIPTTRPTRFSATTAARTSRPMAAAPGRAS